jgi:choline monooxygenase
MLEDGVRDWGVPPELDRVELEDEEIVERVQRGVESRLYDRGRYSPSGEVGTHHFHRLLAAFMFEEGADPSDS